MGTYGGGLLRLPPGKTLRVHPRAGSGQRHHPRPARRQPRPHLGRDQRRRARLHRKGPDHQFHHRPRLARQLSFTPWARTRRAASGRAPTTAGWPCWRGGVSAHFGGADIADQPVWVIHADREGDIWVGTDHAGLLWIRGEKVFRFSSRDGLYSDQAFQILEDERGRLWMNCNKGIYHVAKNDLIAFAAGRLPRIPCVSFGKSEGIKVTESSGPAQPAGCIDRQGRIWFPTIRGLTMFDPDRQHINRSNRPWSSKKPSSTAAAMPRPGEPDGAAGKGQHRDRLHGHQLPASGQDALRLSPRRLRHRLGPAGQPPYRLLHQPAAGEIHLPGHGRQRRRSMEPQRRLVRLHPDARISSRRPCSAGWWRLAALLLVAGFFPAPAAAGQGARAPAGAHRGRAHRAVAALGALRRPHRPGQSPHLL